MSRVPLLMESIIDFLETLAARNAGFADEGFSPELKIIPSQRTMIVGCVDPRRSDERPSA